MIIITQLMQLLSKQLVTKLLTRSNQVLGPRTWRITCRTTRSREYKTSLSQQPQSGASLTVASLSITVSCHHDDDDTSLFRAIMMMIMHHCFAPCISGSCHSDLLVVSSSESLTR
mmetsp:Transcript_87408/g.127837  ORF Transcript_87408/g.127837 Transcript_87408/m.127837 type:complete len:115 (-) Transcript_87408:72-416(-)